MESPPSNNVRSMSTATLPSGDREGLIKGAFDGVNRVVLIATNYEKTQSDSSQGRIV